MMEHLWNVPTEYVTTDISNARTLMTENDIQDLIRHLKEINSNEFQYAGFNGRVIKKCTDYGFIISFLEREKDFILSTAKSMIDNSVYQESFKNILVENQGTGHDLYEDVFFYNFPSNIDITVYLNQSDKVLDAYTIVWDFYINQFMII